MTNDETIKVIEDEIKRQESELKRMREELEAIKQEERKINDQCLIDAVLNCPHSITSESITLRFSQTQKDGHNALSQLYNRLAAYDNEARQREMQLLSEIEALERLALVNLKQRSAPQAQRVPLDAYKLREIFKKLNAKHDEEGWNFADLVREVEVYHGITQDKHHG